MELYGIIIMLGVSVAIGVVVEGLSYLAGGSERSREQLTAYECGIEAIGDTKSRIEIQIYLLGILFIVIDLEASYLFPWGMSIEKVGSVGYWGMMDIIVELGVGYVYVYKEVLKGGWIEE